MFGRAIHYAPSYWFAFGLTLVFSLCVYKQGVAKAQNIDMVESLKSVDRASARLREGNI